ncbi:phosphoserine phosphatase-like isoform X2 [Halichondria panicea]
MGGSVTFQEALRARLGLIKPSREQVEAIKKEKNPKDILTPGIEQLVGLLHSRGTIVYLVSGGFHCMIDPLADYLNIPRENVFANRILFNDKGDYAGFDEEQPTSRTGGKPKVVGQIKEKYKIVVMIGDGATDMEACPPADTFIGFGGNVVREKVKAGAPWFIYSITDLITELQL